MKKWIAYSLVLVLICALFSACGNSELTITLTNKLDYDIVQLYIGEADDEDEGEFVFDDDILEDNDSIEVSVEPTDSKSYSILAMDTSGDYYYFNDLPLSNGAVVKLVATKDGYEAVVTPKNGDRVTVEGELVLGKRAMPRKPPSLKRLLRHQRRMIRLTPPFHCPAMKAS